eukprot:234943_1
MSSCFKCAGYCTTLVLLIAIGISFYFTHDDQRQFNYHTTADVAATDVDLSGQVIIVTGSNTGIGKPTAKVLLSHGATVIMACRNTQKALEARDDIIQQLSSNNFKNATRKDLESRLDFIQLDLSSLRSVETFSDTFQSQYDRLNQLILNAGVIVPQFETTHDGIEKIFGVNHIGHHYLTQLLTSLLIRTAAQSKRISRVIAVSSDAHKNWSPRSLHPWLINDSMVQDATQFGAYNNYGFSKACNVLFAMEYTSRHAKDKVYAVSLGPGPVYTEIARNMGFLQSLIDLMSPVLSKVLKTPSQGAATTVRAATIGEGEFMECGGGYFFDCNIANHKIRYDLLLDYVDANGKSPQSLLWEMTENVLNRIKI